MEKFHGKILVGSIGLMGLIGLIGLKCIMPWVSLSNRSSGSHRLHPWVFGILGLSA